MVALMLAQMLQSITNSKNRQAHSTPVFTFVQVCSAISNSVACTVSSGSLVVVKTYAYGSSAPTYSTSDGTVTLTNVPSCATPALDGTATFRGICVSYNLATTSGTKTYTTTLGGAGINSYVIFVEEYSYTGGPVAFDKNATGCSNSETPPSCTGTLSATPINRPTITPTATGELLVAGAFSNGTQTTCDTPWTVSAPLGGLYACYDLSSSGSVSMNNADATSPDTWVGVIAAFGGS